MKILVTGGTGYIGVALLRALCRLYPNERFYALARETSPKARLASLPVQFVSGDVTHAPSLWKATKEMDVVFHLAGLVSFEQRQHRRLYETNVVGARNVVDACLKNGVKRLIHASSTAAIGATGDGRLSNEETIFQSWQMRIGYMASKYLGELEVMRGVAEGLDAVIVNPGVVIGALSGVENSASQLFRRRVAGKVPFYPIGGAGFVDIEDVAMAHILAWQKGKRGERYIVVAKNLRYQELFELLAKYGGRSRSAMPLSCGLGRIIALGAELFASVAGVKSPITLDSVRLSERTLFYDNAKSREELGLSYAPFEMTLERLLNSYNLPLKFRGGYERAVAT